MALHMRTKKGWRLLGAWCLSMFLAFLAGRYELHHRRQLPWSTPLSQLTTQSTQARALAFQTEEAIDLVSQHFEADRLAQTTGRSGREQVVWLYSLITTDYNGLSMLPQCVCSCSSLSQLASAAVSAAAN